MIRAKNKIEKSKKREE